jgi:hypothetical protein
MEYYHGGTGIHNLSLPRNLYLNSPEYGVHDTCDTVSIMMQLLMCGGS